MRAALWVHPRRSLLPALVLAATLPLSLQGPAALADTPSPIDVSVTGANGSGRINTPGRPCGFVSGDGEVGPGGDGAAWHYDYSAPLAGGSFGLAPSDLRFHLDLHSGQLTHAQPGVPANVRADNAFLLGKESHATVVTQRGTVKLRLASGTCQTPTLRFDGTTVTGAGSWSLGDATGAYRGATSTGGSFTLGATDVAPGADNRFDLRLVGGIEVLKPKLKVEVLGTYWGFLGVDYALRRVTVIYKVTNVGDGDSYGVQLTKASTSTAGAGAIGPVPQKLGDLLAGESETVRVAYQLGLLQPCTLVILGCKLSTTLEVLMPDALDRPATLSATTATKAPTLPPPL